MQTCLINCNKSSDNISTLWCPTGNDFRASFVFTIQNDLPNCLMHLQPRMYADDTSITYASNDVEEIECRVYIDLDRIHIWLAVNKLTPNTTKTEFLSVGSRQRLSMLERNPIIR